MVHSLRARQVAYISLVKDTLLAPYALGRLGPRSDLNLGISRL
jgi:hypothetical protein